MRKKKGKKNIIKRSVCEFDNTQAYMRTRAGLRLDILCVAVWLYNLYILYIEQCISIGEEKSVTHKLRLQHTKSNKTVTTITN